MLTTFTMGSMTAGKEILSHFQFSTSSKSKETQHVDVKLIAFFPNIKGKFGTTDLEEEEWPITIGMNEKGGVDDVEC